MFPGDKGESFSCSGPVGDRGPPGDDGPSGDVLVLVLWTWIPQLILAKKINISSFVTFRFRLKSFSLESFGHCFGLLHISCVSGRICSFVFF